MLRLFKKIFFPSVTDDIVGAKMAESKIVLDRTSETAMRHKALLDKNGFTMRIYIATGSDKHVR